MSPRYRPQPLQVLLGRCAEHPGETLVTARRVGYWRHPDPPTVCPDPAHRAKDRPPLDADRCRCCGEPIYTHWSGTRRGRQYCRAQCRVYALRARRAA